MLEFYEFNTLNMSIVLISTFIIYYILSSKKTGDNEKKSEFSIEYLIISVVIAIAISLIVSYIISGNDESILTDNYWDPIHNEINNNE
jgi:uncharacterized membrane protein